MDFFFFTKQIFKTSNTLLWPFSVQSHPQYDLVKLTLTEPQYPSAKRPTKNTRIRDEKCCFLPDSMFIWRDRASVFIQGQALVSVISRPCCGGNAYYVVACGPCLLWPWGFFPWRNWALRNERSDHRNRPGKEKRVTQTPTNFSFTLQSTTLAYKILHTVTRFLTHIIICLNPSGCVVILFLFIPPCLSQFCSLSH